MSPSPQQHVAVIGGGITGLAAAHRLLELQPNWKVSLLEASPRLGGVLKTERVGEFLIEHGPDMFITREPWALALCQRIGFDSQLINTQPVARRAMVVCRGKLVPVPAGFTLMAPAQIGPILTTPLLSPLGKLRLGWEYLLPRRKRADDESLFSFAYRRFGREAYERLIQPLVGGIYTADPQQLSMQAAMPRFVEMEQKYGSVARAMRKASRRSRNRASGHDDQTHGVRYDAFVAPRHGMETLVTALAERLPPGSVHTQTPVTRIGPAGGHKWSLAMAADSTRSAELPEAFDAVIVAVPAPQASRLCASLDEQLGTELAAIPYAGASVAVLAYRRNEVAHAMDGFGAVVPQVEGRRILAISFASNKFAGRAPQNQILLRVFVGGALQPELMELDDQATLQLVQQELRELLGVGGEPLLQQVARWQGAMPQYHVGHLDRVANIESRVAAIDRLELAGNAYRGVGIPFCIHSGEQAAERIVASLGSTE